MLVAEVLNKMLQKAAQIGMIEGLSVGTRGVELIHLQFADDTLIFCEAKLQHLSVFKGILLSFQGLSGLSVNYTKSALIVLGKDEEWAQRAASFLGCSIAQLPINYLGLPLGANMNRTSSWQGVIDKIQKRLRAWKGTSLSRAGRLTMIKVVLNCMPIYYLSLFRLSLIHI